MTTVARALQEATLALARDDGRTEAELLLAQLLQCTRAWLVAHDHDVLEIEARTKFFALVDRRCRGEPVAHILGRRGFWTLDLVVTADTLIPRPETERLVELALDQLPMANPVRVLDLGTGTGAIALAIASERPRAEVTAVDADARALAIARKNAARLGLQRVRFLRSDWFSAIAGETFNLIATNPPYLAEADPHLAEGDLRFEPRHALASGPDGLDAIRSIVAAAPLHLYANGALLIEHGWRQGDAVRAFMATAGFAEVGTATDLEGRERVTTGRWPG
jgi:release factor glutamine methyltransferase